MLTLVLHWLRLSSFADDTRVMKEVGNLQDAENLQVDLGVLFAWAKENNMAFNGKKIQHLRYGPSTMPIDEYRCKTEEGEGIEKVYSLRDLGVTMSASGNFELHILDLCQKGFDLNGWILRTLSTRRQAPMSTLFKSLVVPKMEYCCQLWAPWQQGLIRKLESVQRSFTAQIEEVRDLKYFQRLKCLRMYSLERRRDRYILIYMWKIIQGMAPNLLDKDKIGWSDDNARIGRYCVLLPLNNRAPKYIQSLRENSFSVHGPKLFNVMSAELRNFEGSLPSFKSKLDNFLSKIDDKPFDPTEPQLAESNCLIEQIRCMRTQSRI